jgi:hypothetical protein
MFTSSAIIIVVSICITIAHANVIEPSTKHVYASEENDLSLAGVGVRVKQIGPIKAKVYSAGVYLEKSTAAMLLKMLHATINMEEIIPTSAMNKKVVIRMARTVGADKMSEALADSVKPRMGGKDSLALKSFQSILAEGLKGTGATNNMKLWYIYVI